MSYQDPQPRNSNTIFFILGAIVVALGVVFWLISDDTVLVEETPAAAPDVTITNEAPAVVDVDPAPDAGGETSGDAAGETGGETAPATNQ